MLMLIALPNVLSLYTRLDNCETEEELDEFKTKCLTGLDPFHNRWKIFLQQFDAAKLGVELGFEKMTLKDEYPSLLFYQPS